MTKVFCWDECGCEVAAWDVEIPDGCTPRQALVLADDHICCATETGDTYDKTVRQVEAVFVLDGLFGQGKETHVYWTAEGSDLECRALAEQELAAYLKEPS